MTAASRGRPEAELLAEAVAALRQRFGTAPPVAMVLGSGLRDFAAGLQPVAPPMAFGEVPHWPAPEVAGHGQQLVVAAEVACLSGRVHLYEGWSPVEVVRAVRTLRLWGCSTFVLTNAAGGIRRDFVPGDLMVVTDHINLTGANPLVGSPGSGVLGPRFPDQSALYDPGLRRVLHAVDGDLREGVYAGLLGPSYETPAEVRMLGLLGADAVGMSTVHEATALGAMGARIAAISLISNAAAGVAGTPLSHDDVVAQGRRSATRFGLLLTELIRRP